MNPDFLSTHIRRIPNRKFSSRINVTLHDDHVNFQEVQYKVPQSFEVEVKDKPTFSKIVNRYILATGGKKTNKVYRSTNFDLDANVPKLKIGDPMIVPFESIKSKIKSKRNLSPKKSSKESIIDCITNLRYRNLIKKLGELHNRIKKK